MFKIKEVNLMKTAWSTTTVPTRYFFLSVCFLFFPRILTIRFIDNVHIQIFSGSSSLGCSSGITKLEEETKELAFSSTISTV
jgi:hypothetical protein